MKPTPGTLAAAATILCACALPFVAMKGRPTATVFAGEASGRIHYAQDGSLVLPADYREWVFLSSGMDMSYNPKDTALDHHTFNNVFASPAAYRTFKATGTWPDHTMLVLELRRAEKQPTLNRQGQTQGNEVAGIEVHLKDASRFASGWAFFDVDGKGRGTYLQPKEACYSCHRDHAAVDTTFTQFYPTLMPVAEAHGTVSPKYLDDLKTLQPVPSQPR